MSYLTLPWVPKIGYGIFTDAFPICQSRKRSYIVLMGTVQCLCALTIALMPAKSASFVCAITTIIYFAQAVMDVVVDGLMVS